jgi:hypothetical protein
MMTPSFIIDGVLLYRLFQFLPSRLAQGKTIAQILWEFVLLFLANAALFKSVPLIIFYKLRYLRRLSHVQIKQKEVVYYKRLQVFYEQDFGYTFFHEYHIQHIDRFVRLADGAIRIEGHFDATCYHRDGSPVHDFQKNPTTVCHKQFKQCTIPGYFDGLDDVCRKLEQLQMRQTLSADLSGNLPE